MIKNNSKLLTLFLLYKRMSFHEKFWAEQEYNIFPTPYIPLAFNAETESFHVKEEGECSKLANYVACSDASWAIFDA